MNIQDEILSKYEIRKSNKEKQAFIEYLRERLTKAGYRPEDIRVEEKGKGICKSRNIVVGNPEKAKVLLGGHYDTCAWLPFPNLMAPTNPPLFWGYQVLLLIMIFGVAAVPGMVMGLISGSGGLAYYLFLLSLMLMMIQLLVGYRNKHTANDNTSGTITLTRILETLSEEDREKVCVIYFDNEEKGLLGSSFFYARHKKEVKDKLLINFDCVGDGDNLITLAKQKAEQDSDYENFVKTMKAGETEHDVKYVCKRVLPLMFPSDQANFKKGIGVCSLKRSCLGFRYVARIHTGRDTICRKENIEYLTEAVQRFLREI